MAPKLKNSGSIEETRKILLENDKEVQKIAAGIINKNGYCYNVKTSLSHEYFPIKTYGNITLPQGKYEAYRIIIGGGAGQNWWCVMFPPLCFVDITTEDVDYKKIDNAMKGSLTPSEYNSVVSSSKNIKIKFKTVEVLKRFLAELRR
jgi:stage II sporulation protein R